MADETKEKAVTLSDKVKGYATAKAPFHKEGEEMDLHPEMLAHLVKAGFATKEKPAQIATKK